MTRKHKPHGPKPALRGNQHAKKENPRTARFVVKLTPDEKLAVVETAESLGVSPSEYARSRLLPD